MSRRWPGWEGLAGIDVEGGCNAARKQGRDYVVMRVMAGPYGVDGPLDTYPVAFYADGHVNVLGNEHFECVTDSEGMFTGIRWKGEDGTDEYVAKLVKPLYVQVPRGESLPFLHYYVGGESIQGGDHRLPIDAAIDCSTEEATDKASATITISICLADDDIRAAVWPLTPESAFAVMNLMRENHGEPLDTMETTDNG